MAYLVTAKLFSTRFRWLRENAKKSELALVGFLRGSTLVEKTVILLRSLDFRRTRANALVAQSTGPRSSIQSIVESFYYVPPLFGSPPGLMILLL